ncbi:MAG: hypothetical protein RLZZ471_991 [Actinomycetota bacterium]
MPAHKWTCKCCTFTVIFKSEKQQLEIEVTDGDYEAHYSMVKTQFKEQVNALGVLFDNDFKSTLEQVKVQGKFEDFVHGLPKSNTLEFVWY